MYKAVPSGLSRSEAAKLAWTKRQRAQPKPGGLSPKIAARVKEILAAKQKGKAKPKGKKGPDKAKLAEQAKRKQEAVAKKAEREKAKIARDAERVQKKTASEQAKKERVAASVAKKQASEKKRQQSQKQAAQKGARDVEEAAKRAVGIREPEEQDGVEQVPAHGRIPGAAEVHQVVVHEARAESGTGEG